jgi:DNA polymerase (family 10)
VDNDTLARALSELADVLELSGESTFRVRAFKNAARAIEATGEQVADAIAKGDPLELPGVGEGILKRLEEMIRTGHMHELEEAKSKLPNGLMELMKLPGIGIKTAQQVWKERGITTVDALEKAAKEGALQDLPRFGKKKEEKLLEAIAAWRKRAHAPKRWPMATALDLAEDLTARMRAIPGVLACEFAGSLRRRRETVGDLDLLVSAQKEDAPRIMDAWARLPEVAEVLGKGETKTSVVFASGLQGDLRVVPPESYGAALQYFTGSKEHNVAMRTLAVKKGLKVSEWGVFEASGASIAGRTEEDVYAAVGMAWMPPEMRENHGEVEAALKGALPVLVTREDLVGDLHVHTSLGGGTATLEEMVESARAAGHAYVAITDHSAAYAGKGVDKRHLHEQVKRVRALEDKLGFRILAGLEVEILPDGTLDLEGELEALDWVVAAVHAELDQPRDAMTKRIVRAVESGLVDCVAHPTGRIVGQREGSAVDLDAVIGAMAKVGVALELNASPLRLDAPESALRLARERGVPVALSSDAHAPEEMERNLRYGLGTARRAWLGPEHVLNCGPAAALAEWRAARSRRA